MLNSTWLSDLLLLDIVTAGLGEGSRVVATPDEDPSPISSTLEGPLVGIPSSKGVPTPLREPSKIG